LDLSIIIPTKDRSHILQQTLLNAYQAIRAVEAEIIVVNDSKTTKINLPDIYKDKITVIENSKNGVASARNLGANHAKGDLLLFLDDDMLISQENIQHTLQLHQTYKHCCINLNWVYPSVLLDKISRSQFGRYLLQHGFTSLKGWNRGEYWDDKQIFPTKGITSQYLSIDKSVFFNNRGYNENFPHAGFEDFEFAQRLKENGVTFYIFPLSTVFHNEEDRVYIEPWLQRKRRGGETRRVAVQMGLTQLKIKYSKWKYLVLKILVNIQSALFVALKIIPNKKYLDFIYFKLINILLATAIFNGYCSKK
jgi:glycosyltransferase involved in cell wall biosynthesis